ncbi:MAG: ornithine--oxo-acid transaminase [Acidobacteria bacterium SCN 69-37]|nr:MAG: ornithine--oxo-acid transaminase [Acidobacteria bacterium SCN 69-37]
MTTSSQTRTAELLAIEDTWGAHNYHPLPIVVAHAQGAWVTDVEGRRYLDCLSAYSALNQGHVHPAILKVFIEQASRVTLTSRAFRNDQLPLFCQDLAAICRLDVVLPMNSGAEAVETAIKAARQWGYARKGIPDGAAEIIVCGGNFHGRTTTIIGFSSDEDYKRGFGPFTPGFVSVPYGDLAALEAAITPNTCAFLFEPIQCEGGILMPPAGFLRAAADVCRDRRVLLVADEIQTGLGRTGAWFACDHEDVQPDLYILGKALSGGFYPVSACVGRREVMELFTPGSHGSTFGGNPLGAAVARAALQVLRDEQLIERSAKLGQVLLDALRTIESPVIQAIRGIGLLAGIELREPARAYCERLLERGVLCKETHERVIRLAPPLVIEETDLLWMVDQVREVLTAPVRNA